MMIRTVKEIINELSKKAYVDSKGRPLEKNPAFERLREIGELPRQQEFFIGEIVMVDGISGTIQAVQLVPKTTPSIIRYGVEGRSDGPYVAKDLFTQREWEHRRYLEAKDVVRNYEKRNGNIGRVAEPAKTGQDSE